MSILISHFVMMSNGCIPRESVLSPTRFFVPQEHVVVFDYDIDRDKWDVCDHCTHLVVGDGFSVSTISRGSSRQLVQAPLRRSIAVPTLDL